MKKMVFILAMLASAQFATAQVIATDLLNGYKAGDKLEKNVYAEDNRGFQAKTWNGAFYKEKPNPNPSPVIGEALSYKGYPESGPSIKLGGFPTKDKGTRVSVCSISEKNKKGKGTLYLSFLVNFSKLGLPGMADLIGLHHSYLGNGLPRITYMVGKSKEDGTKMRFGVGLLKLKAESQKTYDYKKTHLVVIKFDYAAQKASLFVDPKLGGDEPEADAVLESGENSKVTQGINGIVIRNRSNYEGNIGNFRLSSTWAAVTGSATAK